jgi:membrane-associated protein
MTCIGFFLGRVVPNIDKHIEKVIVVIVFLSLMPAIYKYLKHKFSKKPAKETI